jgi:hypothetical protein
MAALVMAGRCGTFPIILVALLAIGCGDAADAAVDASDGAFCGWTSADVTFTPRDELECVRWVETLPGFHGCRDCRPCDVPDRAASCSVALPGEQIRVFVANGQPSVELEAVAYWLTDDGSCPVDCGD